MEVNTEVPEPTEAKEVAVDFSPVANTDQPMIYSLPEKVTNRILQVNKSLQQVHQQHLAKLDEILQMYIDSVGIKLGEKDKINFNPDFKSFTINHE